MSEIFLKATENSVKGLKNEQTFDPKIPGAEINPNSSECDKVYIHTRKLIAALFIRIK